MDKDSCCKLFVYQFMFFKRCADILKKQKSVLSARTKNLFGKYRDEIDKSIDTPGNFATQLHRLKERFNQSLKDEKTKIDEQTNPHGHQETNWREVYFKAHENLVRVIVMTYKVGVWSIKLVIRIGKNPRQFRRQFLAWFLGITFGWGLISNVPGAVSYYREERNRMVDENEGRPYSYLR